MQAVRSGGAGAAGASHGASLHCTPRQPKVDHDAWSAQSPSGTVGPPHIHSTSLALPEVQERRNAKRVPNGLPIHDYVNLYFDARNPMMYSRLNRRGELVIVRVDPAVMSQPGAIITDGNAASESTLFLPSPAGLVQLDESLVYAHSWNDPDPWRKIEKRRARCAEVLIPDRVRPDGLGGCYVFDEDVAIACRGAAQGVRVEVKPYVFFG